VLQKQCTMEHSDEGVQFAFDCLLSCHKWQLYSSRHSRKLVLGGCLLQVVAVTSEMHAAAAVQVLCALAIGAVSASVVRVGNQYKCCARVASAPSSLSFPYLCP
jgi:hypothetical protein